ncbi:MAG: hypothetical protein RIS85_234, partial [Pseudomonadota bacterium]
MIDEAAAPSLFTGDEVWDGIASAENPDAALYLELDGWEGPLDLLL